MADKWKIFSLAIIGLFVLTIVAGYSVHQDRRVQLGDKEKQLAVDVATEALAERITEEFASTVRDVGLRVSPESGATTTIVFVYFSSATDDRAYRVGVDLEEEKAVLIVEARDWMAEGSGSRHGKLGHALWRR